MKKTVILALNNNGYAIGLEICKNIENIEIHGLNGRVDNKNINNQDMYIFDDTIQHIQNLFTDGVNIIGICAAAILIRALAPLLNDKKQEPAVIAISHDGKSIVPLLGGHNGANKLSRQIANIFNSHAAVTTASDICMGFSLDMPPSGYILENPQMMKPITAALLSGRAVKLIHQAGDGSWPPAENFSNDDDAELSVLITDKINYADDNTLVIHPACLVLGVGCERDAPADDLIDFVDKKLLDMELSKDSIALITSIDIKIDELAIKSLAKYLKRPFRVLDAKTIEAELPHMENPSDIVFKETGCHGVAEGCALAFGGAMADLILGKQKHGKYTLAIAKTPKVEINKIGRKAGRLFIVGIGPGNKQWRSIEATTAIENADEIVGYQLYLDLIADIIKDKPTHSSKLGAEIDRAKLAIELAATGKDIALVCSGDPGIYALATLVFELIDKADSLDWNNRDWNGIDIITCPGISAFQAAAARIGAPINHDFCTISLSDLLTPRDVILKRIKAAAVGDFVISFYNPQSKRRRDLLRLAKEILLEYRNDKTPVIIARNLGRDDEEIITTNLIDFNHETVDMLSLVMVGNSDTKTIKRGGHDITYTPRGYQKKMVD